MKLLNIFIAIIFLLSLSLVNAQEKENEKTLKTRAFRLKRKGIT